ncbi:hypothetical protein Tco_0163081 [Tanacetum coccineum]
MLRKGPNWLFDLDYLTDSMNYHSVRSENQANLHAGQQESNQNTGTKDKIAVEDSDKVVETEQDCFELPIWHSYSSTKKGSPREEEQVFLDDLARLQMQEKEANEEAEALRKNLEQETENLVTKAEAAKASSTNIFSTVSTTAKASGTNLVNTVSIPVSAASSKSTNSQEDDNEIPPCEDIHEDATDGIFTHSSYDDEGAVADFTNLETVVNVSPIPTSRINPSHPSALILRDPTSALQHRSKVNDWLLNVVTASRPDIMYTFFACTREILHLTWNPTQIDDLCWCKSMTGNPQQGEVMLVNTLRRFRESLRRATDGAEAFMILPLFILSLDKVNDDHATTMAALESCPKHNMIAYLEKTEGNVEFHEVIDFLRRSYIFHALTQVCPISEASIRTDLIFDDADGTNTLPNQAIFNAIQLMGYKGDLSVLTFNKALFSTPIGDLHPHLISPDQSQNLQVRNLEIIHPIDASLSGMRNYMNSPNVYDLCISLCQQVSDQAKEIKLLKAKIKKLKKKAKPSGEDSLKLQELMALCTTLQSRVLALETTKTTQANEIAGLKRRVKKLERRNKSRTHKLKRLYKVGLSARVESSRDEESLGEDASKQGRRITDIDDDEDITLVNDQIDADMFDVNTLTGDEVLAESVVAAKDVNLSVDEVTLAQALAALKSAKVQEKRDVIKEPSVPVSTVTASTKDSVATTTTATIPTPRKGIVFQEPGTTTTTTISSQQPSQENVHDKGKGKMVEPEKPMKKKELIRLDEEIASKLQAEFDEEAKIEADHELAQRLQVQEQEELFDAEKATLFVQLLEKTGDNKKGSSFCNKKSRKKDDLTFSGGGDDEGSAAANLVMHASPNGDYEV